MKRKQNIGIVPASRPRNPLVVAAKQRKAGSHRPPNKVLRAQRKRALKHELQTLLQGEQYSIVVNLSLLGNQRRLNTVHLQFDTQLKWYKDEHNRLQLHRLDETSHHAAG